MMDNLQDAYTSYQQALYHLRDPKVGLAFHYLEGDLLKSLSGAQALVWHRHTIR